jgi:hypothetical protein
VEVIALGIDISCPGRKAAAQFAFAAAAYAHYYQPCGNGLSDPVRGVHFLARAYTCGVILAFANTNGAS